PGLLPQGSPRSPATGARCAAAREPSATSGRREPEGAGPTLCAKRAPVPQQPRQGTPAAGRGAHAPFGPDLPGSVREYPEREDLDQSSGSDVEVNRRFARMIVGQPDPGSLV